LTLTLQSFTELVRLWYHESQRVFADRLVSDEDHTWFSHLLRDRMKADFDLAVSDVVTSEPLLYADFMAPSTSDVRPYVEITDHEKVRSADDDDNIV